MIRRIYLSVGSEPPTEFRIFVRGLNGTTKGEFLFDDKAARAVMSAYAEHVAPGEPGVQIDLEHKSLDDSKVSYDPDARGWCKLEVRNGELWATGVTWTPDGEARLREKRQRFISPAFLTDKANRVIDIINIGLVANPATHKLQPLVAAKRTSPMYLSKADKLKALAAKLKLAMAENGFGDEELKALHEALEAMSVEEPEEEEAPPAEEKKEEAKAASRLDEIERRLARAEVRGIILANRDKFGPAEERIALKMSPSLALEYAATLTSKEVVAAKKATEKIAAAEAEKPKTFLEQLTKVERQILKATTGLNEDRAKLFIEHKEELKQQRLARAEEEA